LFLGLNEGEVEEILSGSFCRMRKYSRGDLVAQAGEEVFFLNIMVQGSVKGEMDDYAGKVIKIEDIHPPRPLAPAFLFGSQNRYPVNITASDDVKVLSISRDEFLKMMQTNERILRNFVNNVSSRGQFLSNKIKFLSFTSIKGKLAQYLLDMAGKTGSDRIILPLSQTELAELFGVARPSVGRAISEMNHDGIIQTEGKQVLLLDKARLSDLLK
jgi:CRP-like cAMP-binding protein